MATRDLARKHQYEIALSKACALQNPVLDLANSFSTSAKKRCYLPQADGTTLGADNGLGVAAALAILDAPRDAKLPPVEALFTVVSP